MTWVKEVPTSSFQGPQLELEELKAGGPKPSAPVLLPPMVALRPREVTPFVLSFLLKTSMSHQGQSSLYAKVVRNMERGHCKKAVT